MSLPKVGKFKGRKTQARDVNPVERAGSAVPPVSRKAQRRRATKVAKASRRRNR